MSKILVTGGAGFIGSNYIHQHLKNYIDDDIVCLDALTYAGNLENLSDLKNHDHLKFVKGNIQDKELVKKLFVAHNFDYVVHFAAESHVDRSIDHPELFLQSNIIGTQILLGVAFNAWVISNEGGIYTYLPNKKFLQVSTDEVYGSLGGTNFFTEKTPLAPNSPYSASKAGADMLVRAYHETFQFPVNITRCSNNYGPYQFPEKLIPLMIHNIISNKSLPVYGDGLQVRDWIHVSDHCSAIDTVLANGKVGEVYNIGGNNEKTNLELIHQLLKLFDKDDSIIKYVADRPGHDRRYAIDNTKITTTLNWSPKYMFEDGLKETVEWYKEHSDWIESVVSGKYLDYKHRI